MSDSGEGCCWVGVGVELPGTGTAGAVVWVSDAMYSDDEGLASCAVTRSEAGFGEEESGGVGNREAPPVEEICFCSVAVSVESQDRLEGVAFDVEDRYDVSELAGE